MNSWRGWRTIATSAGHLRVTVSRIAQNDEREQDPPGDDLERPGRAQQQEVGGECAPQGEGGDREEDAGALVRGCRGWAGRCGRHPGNVTPLVGRELPTPRAVGASGRGGIAGEREGPPEKPGGPSAENC